MLGRSKVEEINDEAFKLLRDSEDVEQFLGGAKELGEWAIEAESEVKKCVFLRLVARLAKLLRLLRSAPGPKLIAAASAWVKEGFQQVDLAVLIRLRDLGLAEGSVSVGEDVSWLLPEVLKAGQQMSLHLQQPPETVELSDSEAQTPSSRKRPQPLQPDLPQPEPNSDLFSAPLLSELPTSPTKKIRSAAPVIDGDSHVATSAGPNKLRKGYNRWTDGDWTLWARFWGRFVFILYYFFGVY